MDIIKPKKRIYTITFAKGSGNNFRIKGRKNAIMAGLALIKSRYRDFYPDCSTEWTSLADRMLEVFKKDDSYLHWEHPHNPDEFVTIERQEV